MFVRTVQFVELRRIYSVVSSVSVGSNIFHILWPVCLCSPEGLVKLKPVENQYKPQESLQGKFLFSLGTERQKTGETRVVMLDRKLSLCSYTNFTKKDVVNIKLNNHVSDVIIVLISYQIFI